MVSLRDFHAQALQVACGVTAIATGVDILISGLSN